METRLIQTQIDIYGKAPAKYGVDAYKVGLAAMAVLVHAGWVVIGSGKHYQYVRSPSGKVGRQVKIDVDVPTDAEIETLAMQMHAKREFQLTQVLGFAVSYQPGGGVEFTVSWPGSTYPDQVYRRQHAEFCFGISAPWSVNLIWDRGDDAPPTWIRHDEPGEGD